MEKRRRITEDDLRITEAMIAKSYGRLKQSVAQAPSHAYDSVSETIKRRPLTTVAALAGAGLIAYGILRLVIPSGTRRGEGNRQNLTNQVLSLVIPLAAPYLMSYLKHYLGRILTGEHE